MTAAATDVAVRVEELVPLLAMLWDLVPETGGAPSTGTMSHRASGAAPWNPEAGPLLYTISEEARRLEASLRRDVGGRLGQRRGGSDTNTLAALKSISRLAYGVPEHDARRAARIIGGWIREARQTIGEDERPRGVPRAPGEDEATCPYCGTYALRVVARDTRIWCINRGCTDRDGNRPRGRFDRSNVTGEGMIIWADGRTSYSRDLA